ncbi:GIY-YIG nuclease family protein [Noviluteimonas gilva]|uniref:GIY-YIG nuclease family protein n=1 Tax=Noviluteimonas gilva TaxID=2682097 RepID=UPI0018D208E7|nr:GIY-YIG nuclease family protein [Lysobacter gilvus]
MAEGYIYVGGFQPHPDVLYIKAGKSCRPKDRMKQYGTMVPGGLNFMEAAKTDTPNKAERGLLTALAEMEGMEAIGGEWFKCHPFMRLPALDQLRVFGREVLNVRPFCPAPFGSAAPGKRGQRRTRRG